MTLWTYAFDFDYAGQRWRVEARMSMQMLRSSVFRAGQLVDEQLQLFASGYTNPVFVIPAEDGSSEPLHIELGYRNWVSMAMRASSGEDLIFESHPGADIGFAQDRPMLKALPTQSSEDAEEALQRWENNKYSIFADIGLGLLFFAVGKLTGNLTAAALIGAAAGLALVVAQRFVRVDLLGGFAVFGTVMLLISAAFSLVFQSDYMVQMKSTVLGVLTAALFLGDGLLRRGAYFGERMQRYMPAPICAWRMAIGLGCTGLLMAGGNYLVARWMSESAWLNYTTFVDTPLSIGLAYASFFWARAGAETPQ